MDFIAIMNFLKLLGAPTIFAMVCWVCKVVNDSNKDSKLLKKAVQGMMRNQLISDYKMYDERGTITQLELYDWQERYTAYHELGQNGVLDAYNKEIISLPIN